MPLKTTSVCLDETTIKLAKKEAKKLKMPYTKLVRHLIIHGLHDKVLIEKVADHVKLFS